MKQQRSSANHLLRQAQPLSAELVLGQTPTLKEPRLVNDLVLWLEQRPEEGGRTTALIRPWGRKDVRPQELTPPPINLRTRVHEYGGGALAIACDESQIVMTWIDDDDDGCLWTQSFEDCSKNPNEKMCWLKPLQDPRRVSIKSAFCLADGLIDLSRKRWIGVMEKDGKDFLVAYSLNDEDQPTKILHRPLDFAGYAALSPSGDQLVWVEWQKLSMPWEASQLWWASLDKDGEILSKKLLAGTDINNQKQISVFQPIWLPTGELVVAEDQSGWWNLMITGPDIASNNAAEWHRLWPMESEAAMPQWVYGMSTTSAAGEKILSANCKNGIWRLNLLHLDGQISELNQPFDELSGLNAQSDRAVAIASNSLTASGLLELDLRLDSWDYCLVKQPILNDYEISKPEPFWFKGYAGQWTHSWYYPPINRSKVASPLLVKSHSGPTSMARSGLNLEIQFWTSRGWGVVDVNYGGSSGFGRLYRERLKHGWGEVDVFDCAAAAKELVAQGKADKELVAIEGGSAGGFTTLACLCFTDVFRVAACRYAVSDLVALAEQSHRFEAGYLDYLIGSRLQNFLVYKNRSPLNNVEDITCPVIFFQGLKDRVVLPLQTQAIIEKLRENNIPVVEYQFPHEGHGFRDKSVKIKVLKETERFFVKHLKL